MAIFLINGLPESGKDTVGKMIQFLTSSYGEVNPFFDEYLDVEHTLSTCGSTHQIKQFGEPLKKCAAIMLGCDVKDFESHEFKNSVLPEKWWYWKMEQKNKTYTYSYEEYNKGEMNPDFWELVKPTVRDFLQNLGTEVGRTLHPNTWVNVMIANLDKNQKTIITDFRFKNEYYVLKKKYPMVLAIKIEGRGEGNNHISNRNLNDFEDWYFTLNNSGTEEELFYQVKGMLDSVKY